ncbi:putative glycolipid-binding domain-containing protein [Aquamicrobium terrae]|uniref:Transcriptional regulator n=1 Tax=Aquamicrobium terrae TaxID=1324945 RepID=A0ABV2N836_9HYPH
MTVLRWAPWSGQGLQHVVLTERDGWLTAEAVVIGSDTADFAASFRLVADDGWRARRVEVAVSGGLSLRLEGDGAGNWTREGLALPQLAGAVDPDISITPLTNTFPVRRLGLAKGESAEIRTAYIDVPSLDVFADPQRYTCLDVRRRYLYESLDSDFRAEIEFDKDGFVTNYPGLFRRLA